MTSFLARLVACLAVAGLLAGCGPNEAGQRAAFIAFLQTDVLPAKGVRIPALTDEKRKAFGDYAAQYDVITRFHETMNDAVAKPMQEVLSRAAPGSIEEVVKRRSDVEAVRAGMTKMRDALDGAVAAADRERAALKQPDDLAPVYGRAYDKLVATPAATFREIFPATDDAMASVLALADLIEANKGKIKLNGSTVEINDSGLRARIQDAMNAMNDKRGAINAAIQKLRTVMYGG